MKSGRTKEKMVGYNTVPPPAALGTLGNDTSSGIRMFSSSSGAASSSSNFPLPPKQEKPSYNACPPPPNLYGPPSTPLPVGASHSDKVKGGGVSLSGSCSDGEKKSRKRAGRKSKSDSAGIPTTSSDSCISSGKMDGSGTGGLSSQERKKQANGALHIPSASPSALPNPSFKVKHAPEMASHSTATKLGGGTDVRIVDQSSVQRSDRINVQPEKCAAATPSSSDVSSSIESGSHLKPKDAVPSGIPKSSKSKDGNKNAKSNGGSGSRKLGTCSVDQKPSGQRGWRPCTSTGITSSNSSGCLDSSSPVHEHIRTVKSGGFVSSSANENGPAVGPSPMRSLDAGFSYSSHFPPQFSTLAAPAVHILGPDKANNGGTSESVLSHAPSRQSHYTEHISREDASHWIEVGLGFKGLMRVNPYFRNEAYVTIEGVPVDILIDGLRAQNRAMEGDEVVVQLNHVSLWPALRTSNNNKQSSFAGGDDANSRLASVSESEICSLIDDGDMEDDADGMEGCAINNVDSSSEETATFSGGSPSSIESRVQLFDDGGWNESTDPRQGSSELEMSGKSNFSDLKSWQSKSPGDKVVVGRTDPLVLDKGLSERSLAKLLGLIENSPGKRPTGNVVAIICKSLRREAVTGFLELRGQSNSGLKSGGGSSYRILSPQKGGKKQGTKGGYTFVPVDNRFPKMILHRKGIPEELSRRIKDGDPTVSNELVVAQVEEWKTDSLLPRGSIKASLGRGGTIEAQTEAILLENSIHGMEFLPESLACLPAKVPWTIPEEERKTRLDLRGTRVFTIDPPTAKDLDDALSIEQLPDGNLRIGVHIADVSFFVQPNTALDGEAQNRSTSVYLIQKVLPMLPPRLCEELCSLNPGVERLAFSVVWIMDPSGDTILDQWIGRTIIRSCAKLTYGDAQGMIDGTISAPENKQFEGLKGDGAGVVLPNLYGEHSWKEVIADVQKLHEVALRRRENRFDGGALKIESSQLIFHLDEDGEPCDSTMYQHKDSNFLVEEFMLLANMTVAKVISSAFPERSLLRRHPEPNERKLKEFEDFCVKKGFELDTSSSGALHVSLQKIREKFDDDPVLFNILMLYATKPMQLAKYFCTGDLKGQEDVWGHYALAAPLYTHFTSPIRRYPDLVVHRLVAAALEAEQAITSDGRESEESEEFGVYMDKCFSGPVVDKKAIGTDAAQKALTIVAEKHRIPKLSELTLVAAHCNERRLACRNVKDASDKLYLWSLLKRKQGMLSTARVLAIGPKFMSLYICKVALERRIYYDEVDGLNVEWFEATGTLILGISSEKPKKGSHIRGRSKRTVADVALVVNPADMILSGSEKGSDEDLQEEENRLSGNSIPVGEEGDEKLGETRNDQDEVEPTVLPLTLRWFSTVPVSLHATGGESRSLDIAVRLYVSSYAT